MDRAVVQLGASACSCLPLPTRQHFHRGMARARPFVRWDEGLRLRPKMSALLAADDTSARGRRHRQDVRARIERRLLIAMSWREMRNSRGRRRDPANDEVRGKSETTTRSSTQHMTRITR